MNYKYEINNGYEDFKNLVLNIQYKFKQKNQNIHKARNELKIINHNNIDVVIKSFKKPSFLNRIVYTFFKDSKAKKSYDYSIKIGNFTPNAISYVEFYSSGLLSQSYFISERFAYDFTIREPLLEEKFEDKENIFKAFAKFTYDLHEAQIFHKDYSPGNILIKKHDDNYEFKIVDINRMKFSTLRLEERLKNFSKLWAKDEDLRIIAKEYAKLINQDEEKCINLALKFSNSNKAAKNFKKRLRGQKVVD
ncbi:hypothetical protein CP965_10900 [Halarcobacter mediterraneus]|uniref:Protein kinase domain-containing protein n=1 Tax=Halarcobacter mediterraneus TaxID=2023153 RepID=A0A4Q1AT22_9BACT|nr:lipopolysaccharide kinase InaA family protein [Halarcobacter mediterraneus]RXK12268.1 hypothetical protein CP965_10900 [Halarcobacter mediterraneus]